MKQPKAIVRDGWVTEQFFTEPGAIDGVVRHEGARRRFTRHVLIIDITEDPLDRLALVQQALHHAAGPKAARVAVRPVDPSVGVAVLYRRKGRS